MNTTNEIVVTSGKLIGVTEKKTDSKVLTIVINNSGKDVFLRFICRRDLELPTDLKKGDYLNLEGYCRAYSKEVEPGNWSTYQYFIATKVEKATSMLANEFGVAGSFYAKAAYMYKLCGTVIQCKPDERNKDWTRLTIRVDEDNADRKASFVHISMKNNSRRPVIEVNDFVCATCNILTPKKVVKGKTVCFEDIVVSDIAVI